MGAPGQTASEACAGAGAGCVALQNVPGTSGGTVTVYIAKGWKVPLGARLRANDAAPTVIVATGTIAIEGTIDASSTSNDGGQLDPIGAGAIAGDAVDAGANGSGAGGVGNGGKGEEADDTDEPPKAGVRLPFAS